MTPNDVFSVFCVVATITILAVVALQPSPDEHMIRSWVKAEMERMHTNQQPPTGAELNEAVDISAYIKPTAMPDVYFNPETNSIEGKP